MDESSVRVERDFHNLTVNPRRMHLLDEPHGYISALAKDNLAHQMRFSVKTLEDELLAVLVFLKQRVREVHAGVLGDGVDDLADLLRIGTVRGCSLFGMAQTARGDHVHGTRDLLGTLYALDAMANIL